MLQSDHWRDESGLCKEYRKRFQTLLKSLSNRLSCAPFGLLCESGHSGWDSGGTDAPSGSRRDGQDERKKAPRRNPSQMVESGPRNADLS